MAFTNLGFETAGAGRGSALGWFTSATSLADEGTFDVARYQLLGWLDPPAIDPTHASAFDDAQWAKANIVVTADFEPYPSPSDPADADRLVFSGGPAAHYVRYGLNYDATEGEVFTFSCWLKGDTWNYAGLMINADDAETVFMKVVVDFTNGRLRITDPSDKIAALNARVTTYGYDWHLVEMEFKIAEFYDASLFVYVAGFGDADGTEVFSADGSAFFAWGAELYKGELTPRETFEGGWLSNENFVFAFDNEIVAAPYDTVVVTPKLVENFEEKWSSNESYFFSAPPLEAASYDGTPEAFEDFEEDWSSNESFSYTLPAVTAASYDGTPEAFEDFEEDWSSNQSFSYTLPAVTAASYDGTPEAFEDFEEDWTTTMTTL